ncbi:uncharacterized protein LOC125369445 isoform X2 [Ricinus communis]|nr:uncharacterized protein LOC125369445 isoform X2 [Ricinus communis]
MMVGSVLMIVSGLCKDENDYVFTFLAGLNTELDEVRSRILGKTPLPTIAQGFQKEVKDGNALNSHGVTTANARSTHGIQAGKFMASLKARRRNLVEWSVHFRLVSWIKSNLLQIRFLSPSNIYTVIQALLISGNSLFFSTKR